MKTNRKNRIPTFDQEELIWPEFEAAWDEETLLKQEGMFKFSKVKRLLHISTSDLTKISQAAQKKGISTYDEYGFGKPKGSQYILRMSKFRTFYKKFLMEKSAGSSVGKLDIACVPDHISDANDLIKLSGCFLLKDICTFSPFKDNEEVIKRKVREHRNQKAAREESGCWYDKGKRDYFVEMELFVEWFFKKVWVQR